MKISLDWLSEYLTWIEKDPAAIAERLTRSAAEVEEVAEQGALLKDCCVGKILSLMKHPNADRLSVATVETDRGTKTVVCGGTNLREGMPVAFAHVGARVRHGEELVTLTQTKIRGVASEGMICAAEELDLLEMFPPLPEDGDRPVIDLNQLEARSSKLEAGTSLRDVLALTDTVFTINNTAITMRPDLFSHVGVARECVALGLARWKKKPATRIPRFPKGKAAIAMTVECPRLVPRYLSCELAIDGLGETPAWMQRRLMACGFRPINLPVDITNYVALDCGVPLHSFDSDDIRGNVRLRQSRNGERLITLDQVERELPDGALILSDDEGIFDLLGIMGGLRSSTKETTRRIYLHAASLDPVTIRQTIIATGHRTDAATVYEKGVAPVVTEQGFFRALSLFLSLIPGARIISPLESAGENGTLPRISLSVDGVARSLGAAVTERDISRILTDLECTVQKKRAKGELTVMPPLHRLRDLAGPHDLIEEIGRVRGFDGIDPAMPAAPLHVPERAPRPDRLRAALQAAGFFEIVPLSFVSPALLAKCNLPAAEAVAIENPLGLDTSLLQTSPLPHLLAHAAENLPRTEEDLRTFQWGRVFGKDRLERTELGLLSVAKKETGLLDDPFLRLKADLQDALRAQGYTLVVEPLTASPSWAHPGRAALLRVGDTEIGVLCEVHPEVRARFDLPARATAAVVDLTLLFSLPPSPRVIRAAPAFPAVTWDVTVKRTHDQSNAELLAVLRKASPLLEGVEIADLYHGAPLREGQFNLTLRFTYRASDRTLTEEEARKEHEKVLKKAGIAAE